MEVSSFPQPLVAVATPLPDEDEQEIVDGDAMTKCGRCRLNFVRHPSISSGDSPKWWLCAPCRARLLGDETRTGSRWSS